ncbi:MAG: right-handed parallel beta-helix repeat-containing protein [Oscillospiraceae bacterium]|nr:right-handed parallel beta-helix repeat-containing protein [Oscillospiraceae bacterium]
MFCYTEILPETENFEISATFTVKESSERISWQSGYGIFVADTVNCDKVYRRYRNLLGVGRFRTRSTVRQSAGMRVVSGYRDADAAEVVGNRILDLSRDAAFPGQAPRIVPGERYYLRLEKTDEGFHGSIRFQDETQTFFLPGCDFLLRQDPHKLYVGFAVAGAMTLEVSEIRFLRSPGKSSVTPEGTIRMALPDYPFPRELRLGSEQTDKVFPSAELFVSPGGKPGGDGSRSAPLELHTALAAAEEGQTIWLMDGIYRPKEPYHVPDKGRETGSRRILLRAEHAGKAILDGGDLLQAAPLFILRGNAWHLKDLIFRNSPLSGLLICGSGNLIEHCEAYQNRDTGILICTYPGTGREKWPKDNRVVCCDSHHNRDAAGENADGFGAKLSVGEGNAFFECIAHHNVDDGFDLFSKNVLGPIGTVTIENCVAFDNGPQKEEEREGKGGGMGFKLGGDHLAIPHRVLNCIAFQNHQAGFSTNNNPNARMENLTAWKNGKLSILYNYQLTTKRTDIVPDWRLSGLLPEKCVNVNAPGRGARPVVIQENPGRPAAEIELQLIREQEKLFISTDTAVPITRDENDLIDMHGLFVLKKEARSMSCPPSEAPGAKLDAEHLEERLERKQKLS